MKFICSCRLVNEHITLLLILLFVSFFNLKSRNKRTVFSNTKPCVSQKLGGQKSSIWQNKGARFARSNIPFKELMLLYFGMSPCMAGYYLELPNASKHTRILITLFGFNIAYIAKQYAVHALIHARTS